MIGGIKPEAKNTGGSAAVGKRGHAEELGLCSPSRAKKAKNMAREPSMVINPYQGKESNNVAQAIGAGPYLSLSEPKRIPATARAVRIHCMVQEGERTLNSQNIVGTTAAMNAVPAP